MRIGKYAFNSKEQAQDKIDALGVAQDEEGNTYKTHKHTIIELGYEVITDAIINEEGEAVTEAIYGTDYLVDVLWRDLEADENGEIDHPYGWKSYSVVIETEGKHSFMGLKYQDLKF
jgi:hypothetical protein